MWTLDSLRLQQVFVHSQQQISTGCHSYSKKTWQLVFQPAPPLSIYCLSVVNRPSLVFHQRNAYDLWPDCRGIATSLSHRKCVFLCGACVWSLHRNRFLPVRKNSPSGAFHHCCCKVTNWDLLWLWLVPVFWAEGRWVMRVCVSAVRLHLGVQMHAVMPSFQPAQGFSHTDSLCALHLLGCCSSKCVC